MGIDTGRHRVSTSLAIVCLESAVPNEMMPSGGSELEDLVALCELLTRTALPPTIAAEVPDLVRATVVAVSSSARRQRD